MQQRLGTWATWGLAAATGTPRAKEGWAQLAMAMGRRVTGLGCSSEARMHMVLGT